MWPSKEVDHDSLNLDGEAAFKLSLLQGDLLLQRDVRGDTEEVWSLKRTAHDAVLPLPSTLLRLEVMKP